MAKHKRGNLSVPYLQFVQKVFNQFNVTVSYNMSKEVEL